MSQDALFDFTTGEASWRERPWSVVDSSYLNKPAKQSESLESRDAAREIEPHVTGLQQRLLDFLEEWGPATDEQIADALGMNPSTERPRRIELERAGLVVQAGVAKTKSGRSAALWKAA